VQECADWPEGVQFVSHAIFECTVGKHRSLGTECPRSAIRTFNVLRENTSDSLKRNSVSL
jgi:hypothetical protein